MVDSVPEGHSRGVLDIGGAVMVTQGEQGARGFAAGVFIGLAIVMPVFAATTPELEQWALPLMFAATMLLIVGMTIAAMGLREVNRERPPLTVRARTTPAPARPRERRLDRRMPGVA